MLCKPDLMALLPVKPLEVKGIYRGDMSNTPKPYFHYQGSFQKLLPFLLDSQKAGEWKDIIPAESNWCGFQKGETLRELLSTGICQTTLDAFKAAEATIETPFMRDRPQLSVIGSSFSMGRVMQGHPVQCFRRPKLKLPPKKIELAISASSGYDIKQATPALAKINKAIMQYHLAGGAVEFLVHYGSAFTQPNAETKAQGLVFSFKIAIGDNGILAFAASLQFLRGIFYQFCGALSGVGRAETCPVITFYNRDIIQLSGLTIDLDKALSTLNVQ